MEQILTAFFHIENILSELRLISDRLCYRNGTFMCVFKFAASFPGDKNL